MIRSSSVPASYNDMLSRVLTLFQQRVFATAEDAVQSLRNRHNRKWRGLRAVHHVPFCAFKFGADGCID
jgi:hypothetical protein